VPRLRRTAVLVALALAALPAGPAAADDNDLVLSRLAEVVRDGAGVPIDAVGDSLAFRALASELGVVLAPRLGEPADTLGFGGFALTADMAFTSISSDAAHWRALESSPAPGEAGVSHGNSVMTTVGVFAKKGIWLPLPSFEVGLGAVHLLRSRTWAAQAYGKLALHEGYHDLVIPSLALRGGVSRMMGQSELNLTIASIDAVVSKDFGVAGTFRLTPYLGWNWLVVIARSEVVDATPEVDSLAMPADRNADFVFVDQDDIVRDRFVAGLKLKYYVLTFGLEAAVARAGRSTDDRAGTDAICGMTDRPTSFCDSPDTAARQTTITATIGADF
jgi:hypothetical protein